ncbi:hypothetical protein HPB50_019862 [Hyalomma asiaticum]|uniref:Uncharacterized protein n=1 Tax=Hyalomma asiaticum TaxID=266040 RepID=A0ACB7RKE8_HYAAI|nr:hypothetical protein HPB50_019862 [Hyalomma asiaticum]
MAIPAVSAVPRTASLCPSQEPRPCLSASCKLRTTERPNQREQQHKTLLETSPFFFLSSSSGSTPPPTPASRNGELSEEEPSRGPPRSSLGGLPLPWIPGFHVPRSLAAARRRQGWWCSGVHLSSPRGQDGAVRCRPARWRVGEEETSDLGKGEPGPLHLRRQHTGRTPAGIGGRPGVTAAWLADGAAEESPPNRLAAMADEQETGFSGLAGSPEPTSEDRVGPPATPTSSAAARGAHRWVAAPCSLFMCAALLSSQKCVFPCVTGAATVWVSHPCLIARALRSAIKRQGAPGCAPSLHRRHLLERRRGSQRPSASTDLQASGSPPGETTKKDVFSLRSCVPLGL